MTQKARSLFPNKANIAELHNLCYEADKSEVRVVGLRWSWQGKVCSLMTLTALSFFPDDSDSTKLVTKWCRQREQSLKTNTSAKMSICAKFFNMVSLGTQRKILMQKSSSKILCYCPFKRKEGWHLLERLFSLDLPIMGVGFIILWHFSFILFSWIY